MQFRCELDEILTRFGANEEDDGHHDDKCNAK